MAVEFVNQALYFWHYGSSGGFYASPSVGDGEIIVSLKIDNDGRASQGLPYIQNGTRYFTVAKDQSGGGQAWTGSAKICYHLTPDSGVNQIWSNGGAQGTMALLTLRGVNPDDAIGQTFGSYGFGNPNRTRDTTPDDAENSLLVGGAHCGTHSGYYGSGNEGTNIWIKESDYNGDVNEYERTKLHQYSELSTGGYGSVVRHFYEWGGYPDNVLIVAEFLTAMGGSSEAIWCMSKIYDRIQENRKKLGIGDLGSFGLKGGLWKPKSGMVTI